MDEPLTDDARVVLAFITDHPGCAYYNIANEFRIGKERAREVLRELLQRRLIVNHYRPTKHFSEQQHHMIASTFYPV